MTRLRLSFYSSMMVLLLLIILLSRVWGGDEQSKPSSDGAPRTAVLVELFTSEGCSDCPPADALLERLDRSQPVSGVELIVLSEHVDYWNGIGWKDPYSSHTYSERQSAYAGLFNLGSVYTPQMVVDGHFEFVGSDQRRAVQAIRDAAKVTKLRVNLSSVHLEANTVTLHLDAGQLPVSGDARSASVYLALADERDESHVSGGENRGRTLNHIAVVRSLSKIGDIDQSAGLSRDLRFNLDASRGDVRIVAFIQEENSGKILGAGVTRF